MPTFYNQATLTYNNTSTNSNIVQGEYVETISACKTALTGDYRHGDNVCFAISIVNSGCSPCRSLNICDDLGAYTCSGSEVVPLTYIEGSLKCYLNGVLQATPDVSTGAPLCFSGIDLPAESNLLLVYSANVNCYAPLGRNASILNTVQIEGETLGSAVTAQAIIRASSGLQLSISKAICPAKVMENCPVTYTLTIINNGSSAAVATDEVVVSDTFDPVLDISQVSFNGDVWTQGVEYDYDETSGAFSTMPTFITVPAASYAQDGDSGIWHITPGISTLVIHGTI